MLGYNKTFWFVGAMCSFWVLLAVAVGMPVAIVFKIPDWLYGLATIPAFIVSAAAYADCLRYNRAMLAAQSFSS